MAASKPGSNDTMTQLLNSQRWRRRLRVSPKSTLANPSSKGLDVSHLLERRRSTARSGASRRHGHHRGGQARLSTSRPDGCVRAVLALSGSRLAGPRLRHHLTDMDPATLAEMTNMACQQQFYTVLACRYAPTTSSNGDRVAACAAAVHRRDPVRDLPGDQGGGRHHGSGTQVGLLKRMPTATGQRRTNALQELPSSVFRLDVHPHSSSAPPSPARPVVDPHRLKPAAAAGRAPYASLPHQPATDRSRT